MEAAFATLRQYATNLGDIARHQLIAALHEFAYSLEDANDTVHRYGYLVSPRRVILIVQLALGQR